MIEIELSQYDKNFYKYKLISHLDPDEVYFLSLDELLELELDLKDALNSVRYYIDKELEKE